MQGSLGTWASFSADLNLLVQIAMGLALLGGAVLARAKRYTAHGVCQAAVLILNLPMIALVMWASLQREYCRDSPVILGNEPTQLLRCMVFWGP
jgi:hypothetical protein